MNLYKMWRIKIVNQVNSIPFGGSIERSTQLACIFKFAGRIIECWIRVDSRQRIQFDKLTKYEKWNFTFLVCRKEKSHLCNFLVCNISIAGKIIPLQLFVHQDIWVNFQHNFSIYDYSREQWTHDYSSIWKINNTPIPRYKTDLTSPTTSKVCPKTSKINTRLNKKIDPLDNRTTRSHHHIQKT